MLIIGGEQIDVPGLDGASYWDNKDYALKVGSRPRRTGWVRGIVLHTRMGIWPQTITTATRNRHWDELVARRWEQSGKAVGAHIAIDGDGSYVCLADLMSTVTYHAGQVNEYTVGIEMYQEADGTIYNDTLQAAVILCDVITRNLGIQRQYPLTSEISRRFATPTASFSASPSRRLAYMPDGMEGRDFVGVYGHRNVTKNRGKGDPGDKIFEMLSAAGYEGYDIDHNQDRNVWAVRQREVLGMDEDDVDGIPGPMTLRALKALDYPWGMYVRRPGDDPDGIFLKSID